MLNGIKKLFITSLFVIFGLCFNSSFGYTQTDNCYFQPGYSSYKGTCRDYEINELISTEYDTGGTIYYDGNFYYNSTLNILGYKQYFENSSHSGYASTYLIYNEFSGTTMFNGIEYNDLGKTSIYLQTGTEAKYCTYNTGDSNAGAVCATPRSNKAQYNKTVQQVQEGINGASLTGFRVYYGASSSIAVPNVKTIIAICLSFDNGFNYCMPFETHTDNSMGNTMTRAGYTTQTKIVNEQSGIIPLTYILENYTNYPNPFDFEHEEIPTTGETEITNNYACPTIQQIINTYPNQYNTGLCYSSSLIFSGGTIQQVEPKDIFTLYPLYTGFVTDINLYNNYCVGPNTQTACETAFTGKTEQYTLISKIPDNVKKANLYAYCNLQLNYEDKNASTCVTSGAINTGEYIPPITNQGVIDELIDGDYNIVLPASGYVMDTLKDENGERKIDWNIIESIQNLYSKFTTIFTGREGNNGIIPEYITRMILVIILFAFFKK